jgi:acetolactate synthase-1/2/3 large subunit
LIVAGGGVVTAGASAELTAIAEQLDAPVVTSIEGRGSIPEDHPLSLGPNTDLALMDPTFAHADVVFAVGTRFQQGTPVQRALWFPGTIVHLDADPAVFHKVHRARVTVAADARLGLQAISAALGDVVATDPAYLSAAQAARRAADEEFRGAMGPDFERIMNAIHTHLPPDGVVVKDATIPSYVWGNRALPVLKPRTSIRSTSSAIGPALPTGVGAAAGTGKPTVVIHGDGGIMLTIGELATAVQLGVPLVVCVFNDKGYGILRFIQNLSLGGRHTGVDLATPDFAALAQAVGMDAVNVGSADAFESAFAKAIASGRPWLLDIDVTALAPMKITPQKPTTR